MAMPNMDSTQSYPTVEWNLTDADASRTGAFLYVIERSKESEILAAIRAAYDGDIYLQPAAIRLTPRRAGSPGAAGAGRVPLATLTRREIDVLRLLARGHTNRQAADILGLSVRTVENHRANLLQKLGVASRVEIVRYATEFNLI